MRKAVFILCFLFLLPLFSIAKKLDSLNHEKHKEFYFHWDNDIFLFSDYYYTQGAKLFYADPIFRKNPLNHVFVFLNEADNYFGVGIVQEIYTPKNISNALLDTIDRPYAGALYLRSFAHSSHPEKRLRLSYEFDLGLLGPLSGADKAQKYIHEWLGSTPPMGWDFQIESRPYINYNVEIEKGFNRFNGVYDLMGSSKLRVGNIHNDLELKAGFRVGRLNNYFKALNLPNKKYSDARDLHFYLFGSAGGRGVLYNATLMGGIIPPKRFHQFEFNEIKNFVGELSGGIILNYRYISLKGELTWKTPEFDTGETHGWGTVSLYIRL